MYHHSVVKVKKKCRPGFFKIQLQSLIYNNYCMIASNNICFQKSDDMLNKKTLGVKKVQGQLEAALQTGATKNFDIS